MTDTVKLRAPCRHGRYEPHGGHDTECRRWWKEDEVRLASYDVRVYDFQKPNSAPRQPKIGEWGHLRQDSMGDQGFGIVWYNWYPCGHKRRCNPWRAK